MNRIMIQRCCQSNHYCVPTSYYNRKFGSTMTTTACTTMINTSSSCSSRSNGTYFSRKRTIHNRSSSSSSFGNVPSTQHNPLLFYYNTMRRGSVADHGGNACGGGYTFRTNYRNPRRTITMTTSSSFGTHQTTIILKRHFSYHMSLYNSLTGKIESLSDHMNHGVIHTKTDSTLNGGSTSTDVLDPLITTTKNQDISNENSSCSSNHNSTNTTTKERSSVTTKSTTTTTTTRTSNRIGLACYTCGPTTYAPAHLGHGRTYVWLDIMRRCMEYTTSPSEPPPIFVMNITDVDDKIIQAAANDATTTASSSVPAALELARRYEHEFWYDLQCLNCLRPHYVTRVSEYIDCAIIPYIQRIINNQMAYEIKNSNNHHEEKNRNHQDPTNNEDLSGIYFDVQAYERFMGDASRYGKFTKQPTGSGSTSPVVENESNIVHDSINEDSYNNNENNNQQQPRTQKRDVRDFVLWKTRKPHETLYWMSPWGEGRPGWHIECSAMIESVQNQLLLGNTTNKNVVITNNNKNQSDNNNNNDDASSSVQYKFILHCGGIDLKFPHHTNEIAQAEAYHYQHGTTTTTSTVPHVTSDGSATQIKSNEGGCCHLQPEWIPHWIHTGHLHIDGMKMSKSLKNFITIQQMLNEDFGRSNNNNDNMDQELSITSSLSSSPADDFRLWCLGLSGSYRGTATYSSDRRIEAQRIRQKIVSFLLNGEQYLSEHNQPNTIMGNNKKWRIHDHAFFTLTNDIRTKCHESLFFNDLDGTNCLQQLMKLVDEGLAYLVKESTTIPNGKNELKGPLGPLAHSIQTVRDLLTLIGFTETTTRAGIQNTDANSSSISTSGGSGNKVMETKYLNEMVRFRSLIRQVAIQGMKKKKEKNTNHDNDELLNNENAFAKILEICDEAREVTFPSLGVELLDGLSGFNKKDNNDDHHLPSTESSWRYCQPVPLKIQPKTLGTILDPTKVVSTPLPQPPLDSETSNIVTSNSRRLCPNQDVVPVQDYFRVGSYSGQFLDYDDSGVPIKNADGTDISNRQKQKYAKKLMKYKKRLHGDDNTEP